MSTAEPHRRKPPTSLLLALALVALLSGATRASGFGTIQGLGQANEHERITRVALECPRAWLAATTPGELLVPGLVPRRDVPGRCIEPRTMHALAGVSAQLADHPLTGVARDSVRVGAVGASDIDAFFASVPHCTDGDFLPNVGYSRSQKTAELYLSACRQYLLRHFEQALDSARDLVDPRTGAIDFTGVEHDCRFVDGPEGLRDFNGFLLKAGAKMRTNRKVRWFFALPLQSHVTRIRKYFKAQPPLTRQTAKCRTLANLGRVLHVAQDFYAHSNWTDSADRLRPTGIHNPPGLKRSTRAPLLDPLRKQTVITEGLITACFGFPLLDECNGRIDHDEDLAKDKGEIKVEYATRAPWENQLRVVRQSTVHPRAAGLNFNLAAEGAVRESRGLWKDFGTSLLKRYPRDGATMICILARDNRSECGTRVFHYRVAIELTGGSSSWTSEYYNKTNPADPENHRGSGRGTSSWRAEWSDVPIRLNRTDRRVFSLLEAAASFVGRASGELTTGQYYNSPIAARRTGSTCRYDDTVDAARVASIGASAVAAGVVAGTYDRNESLSLTVSRGPGVRCAGFPNSSSMGYAYDGAEECHFGRGRAPAVHVPPIRIPIARLGEGRIALQLPFRHEGWGCFASGGLGDSEEYCGPPFAPGFCAKGTKSRAGTFRVVMTLIRS